MTTNMPTRHSLVDTDHGPSGLVTYVGAGHFEVLYYDVGVYTIYPCDPWTYSTRAVCTSSSAASK
jgi:hypothetical protein